MGSRRRPGERLDPWSGSSTPPRIWDRIIRGSVGGLGRRFPGVGEPDLAKVSLRLRVESLGHLAEHVVRRVNPAPLLLGRRVDLPKRGPEGEGPITNGQLRWLPAPPLLKVEEQLLPVLLALTEAVDDGDQFLAAFGRDSHEDQQALLLVALIFQTHIHVDSVGADGDELLTREMTMAPLLTLLPPLLLEPHDDVGAQLTGLDFLYQAI